MKGLFKKLRKVLRNPKEKIDWPMMLKKCPDNEFMAFFEDNPEMRYVAEDYEGYPYLTSEERAALNDKVNQHRSDVLKKMVEANGLYGKPNPKQPQDSSK